MWNTELISSITIGAAATVPIIVAIVQSIKMFSGIADKYAPIISIGVGILVAFLLAHDTGDISANILSGILFGLAASGLYSGIQATSFAIRQQRIEEKRNK